ncbi:MAG: hypothetical protein OET79_13075, partial [Nitrospirota bacterium]|nr:hypothetical protein [Nitrospirota bacterium]
MRISLHDRAPACSDGLSVCHIRYAARTSRTTAQIVRTAVTIVGIPISTLAVGAGRRQTAANATTTNKHGIDAVPKRKIAKAAAHDDTNLPKMKRKDFEGELYKLQVELTRL